MIQSEKLHRQLQSFAKRNRRAIKLYLVHAGVALMGFDMATAWSISQAGEHVAWLAGSTGATLAAFASYLE